jgi:hypothetical protein
MSNVGRDEKRHVIAGRWNDDDRIILFVIMQDWTPVCVPHKADEPEITL